MLSQDLSGSLREGHGEREVPGGGGGGCCGPLPAPGLFFPPSAGGSGLVRSLQQGYGSFL